MKARIKVTDLHRYMISARTFNLIVLEGFCQHERELLTPGVEVHAKDFFRVLLLGIRLLLVAHRGDLLNAT